ncbi:MAG: PorV/PorQ family protein [Candidatus Neomarinimicrobiota bacterium]
MLKFQRLIHLSTAILVIIAGAPTTAYSQIELTSGKKQKIAQTGYQFLSIGSNAQAAALADAMTTMPLGSSSLFYNPAGIAHMDVFFDAMMGRNYWIADITHNAFAVAINPWNGRYGALGVSLINVDYGEFLGTMVWPNDKGYIDTEIFTPSALALGVGYGLRLSERFAVGGQVKYATQYLGWAVTSVDEADSLALNKAVSNAVAYDFGTLYRTGFKDLVFGMSVRNFSNEIKYVYESFQLPLTFRIGASLDLFNFWGNRPADQSLMLMVDAAHPRSHPEHVNFGVEYSLKEMLHIRGGYMLNMDEQDLSFGLGLNLLSFALDYAYTPFGVLGNVQCFSLRFLI